MVHNFKSCKEKSTSPFEKKMLNNKSYAVKCNPYQLTINMRRYWEKRKKLHDKRQCSLTYSADPVINKKGNNRKGKENFSKQRIKQPALASCCSTTTEPFKAKPNMATGSTGYDCSQRFYRERSRVL